MTLKRPSSNQTKAFNWLMCLLFLFKFIGSFSACVCPSNQIHSTCASEALLGLILLDFIKSTLKSFVSSFKNRKIRRLTLEDRLLIPKGWTYLVIARSTLFLAALILALDDSSTYREVFSPHMHHATGPWMSHGSVCGVRKASFFCFRVSAKASLQIVISFPFLFVVRDASDAPTSPMS
jgi:hypothetical protein